MATKERPPFQGNRAPSTNGNSPVPKDFPYTPGKSLEADKVFPSDPESAYLSSYFIDSYKFPYNPDPLCSSNNYKIYDEMRHDDQVKSVLSFKKDLIVAPGWEIRCENVEIKEMLERNLREGLSRCSFEDALRDILSAYEYGFSLSEVLYTKPIDGLIQVKDIKTRPPHTFLFYLDDKGDVDKIVQRASNGSIDFEPGYLFHYLYQPEFGNPYGRSDLRAAHQAWKTKKFFLRFWAIYVERFAAPTILGEYPGEYDSSKVARLQAVLKTIQNSTVAVVPEGTKIDFKLPQRDSSDIYEKGVSMLNTMVARALLMPDLLGMSGEQTRGGSYALGNTQFQLFLSLIKKEQEALARKITTEIIQPLVRVNWGDYPCTFAFKAFSMDDALEAAKIWVDATKSKVWDPNDEEVNHLREMLKFPTGDVEKPDPVPVQPISPAPQPNSSRQPMDEERLKRSLEPVLFFREKTAYERKVDFGDIRSAFTKIEGRAATLVRAAAKDIWTDLLDQIKERNLLSRFKPEAINDLKPRFQKPMNVEMRTFLKDAYVHAYTMAQKEMMPDMERKLAMTEELLPEEFLAVTDAEAFKLVGDYSVNVTTKMRNQLVQGIKTGMNERELLKDLRELGQNETDRWLDTVIRTKATEMFNRARKSYWDNDEIASQMVEAYQFSAILDDRTSEVCRYMDGKIFGKDEFITRANPPLHFNCRSILVPITKFEEYELNREPSVEKLKGLGGNLIV